MEIEPDTERLRTSMSPPVTLATPPGKKDQEGSDDCAYDEAMDRRLLSLLRALVRDLSRDSGHELQGAVTLSSLATRAGRSQFHLHRALRQMLGETPKQFIQRLRLERAAGKLIGTDASVLNIALSCGFASHEVFTRAFRRQFARSPSVYRAEALAGATRSARASHIALTTAIGPCIRLFQISAQHTRSRTNMPTLSILRQNREEQPILLIRRRIPRTQLQGMLADCFGALYAHGHKAGLPIAGWPLARYVTTGAGLWTVEAAMPLASAVAGEGEMQAGILPGGPVAMGLHAGSYEELPETNAAIEQWIEAHGLRVGGAPWESYVTDPAEHPDPADWRTEVYWPLAE
jgi:AraC-like DNA-binding protein/effector-binding domain-containing protein